ncbi:MAG: RidA family protein [Alphaproteobacteria bacterium]|nr:RidA family protein [Alphaproteobacteria bacterium]
MTIKLINPKNLYDGSAFGMSHATLDTDSGIIYISGQVGWDSNAEVVNNDIKSQTISALQNLKTVLEAANSSFANILHIKIYVRGEVADHIQEVMPLIAEFYQGHRPATTGIGVASLATPETLIEIEATAKIKP